MKKFLNDLPKIELHAHLNGSLNTSAIQELGEALHGSNTPEFLELCNKFTKFHSSFQLSDCFEKFKFIHELTATKQGLQLATELVIRDFAKDNVIYLEIRTTPKENVHMSRREYLECVLTTIREAQDRYPKISVKLLPSIDRSQPLAVAEQTIDMALEYRKKMPNLIVGIDFSGNPQLGEFKQFKNILGKAREARLPLALHCAEVNNPAEAEDMIEFGMQRCGHGTFLTALQIAKLQQQQVAIECCLSSNIKSGTIPSYENHHLRHIMAVKCDAVLCTDDTGVFDTTLSQEFGIAVHNLGISREQCMELTLTAVKHCFATTEEKRKLIQQLMVYQASITE